MRRITSIPILLLSAFVSTHADLKVIGSGYGRTGTDTLREALNELGYKTYHMHEIIHGRLLSDVRDWTALMENNCDDAVALKDLFDRGGWTAVVDFPASICWETLMRIYPDAKIVHTERDSEETWWDSVSNSIAILPKRFLSKIMMRLVPFFRSFLEMITAMWSSVSGENMTFSDPGGPLAYESQLVGAYSANNQRVRQFVPSGRLLIQDHGNGWHLLAEFLGKNIPDKPYPYRNTRAEVIGSARRRSVRFSVAVLVFLAVTVFIVRKLVGLVKGRKKNKKE